MGNGFPLRRWFRAFVMLVGVSLALLAFFTLTGWFAHTEAQGSTVIVVTTDADLRDDYCDIGYPGEPYCSLREALETAKTVAGNDPVTIVFSEPYTIVLTYKGIDADVDFLVVSRSQGPVHIDGDINDDGVPDVVIDGRNLTERGSMGLFVKTDYVTVEGVIIRNATCDSCMGIDVWGDHAYIVNSAFVSNTNGIKFSNGAAYGVVSNCIASGNTNTGIRLTGYAIDNIPEVVTPSHHITITHSYIGTDQNGNPWGNGMKGVLIQYGSHHNYIANNVIAYNGCFGIHIRNGYPQGYHDNYRAYGNVFENNYIAYNGTRSCIVIAGVVNDSTHSPPGDIPSFAGGYDNVIVSNTIKLNAGLGIFNIGASPLITGNLIEGNWSYGIYNQVNFMGTEDPAHADDDILSIPLIENNRIQNNGAYGIKSLDTAPVNRKTLHIDNNIGSHPIAKVQQLWYGAVEVITGTVSTPIPVSSSAFVRLTSKQGEKYVLGYYAPWPGYNSGIWGTKDSITSSNVTSWTVFEEFYVDNSDALVDQLPYTVEVYLDGIYTGTVLFSFDGLTSTHPVSGDVLIPTYLATGPFGRYQVAEVNFIYDTDEDSIPDVVEGDADPDNDGIPNYIDDDADNDNIPDAEEGYGDSDGDGIPDYLDTDSDNDGIPDAAEGYEDSDGDGIPNYLDDDSDNDGIPDATEGTQDSDNDGIPDFIESNTDDTDGDGIPNYLDTDSDGDGIPDGEEYNSPGEGDEFCADTTLDTDGDGIPNCQDNDVDGDGIPNYLDGDSDGDWIRDADEGTGDSDGDGIPDFIDPADGVDTSQGGDSDGDGIPDAEEYSTGDDDPLGGCTASSTICTDNDVDGDGIPNYLDTDSDGDGIPDATEGTGDSDGDGIPNYLDRSYVIYLPIVVRNA